MSNGDRRRLVIASLPDLRRGDDGTAVKRLQALLNVGGAGLAEDGNFGPATEAAVRAFQRARHLVVDGIVGPQTWTALLSVPGRSPDVILQQPQPFDIVDNPILLAGIGRGFEGTLGTRVRGADGALLAESFVQGGAFTLANFQGTIGLPAVPTSPQGTLEVAATTGAGPGEGPAPDRVVVPIVFGRALIPTYIGFHPRSVREGETLSGLAAAFYGDPSLFPRIFEANRNVLTDPDEVVPGQVLRIPFGEDTVFPPGG